LAGESNTVFQKLILLIFVRKQEKTKCQKFMELCLLKIFSLALADSDTLTNHQKNPNVVPATITQKDAASKVHTKDYLVPPPGEYCCNCEN
jgi:hypothetical protein